MGTTPIYNLPFPDDTDLVIQAPQQFESLAVAAESSLSTVETNSKNAANLTSGLVPVDRIPNLDAGKITSGTVGTARLSGSYTGVTGTGALNAGSITSGFGAINNGASNITTTGTVTGGNVAGNGSALTALNASNLASGTVAAARLPFQFQTGSVTGQLSSGQTASTTVTFASGRFSSAPQVIVGHGESYSDASRGADVYAGATSISSTGFTMFRSNGGGSSLTVTGRWMAMQGAA